jgi:hypothetical protein
MSLLRQIVSLLFMLAACSCGYAKDNSNLNQEQYASIIHRIGTPSLGLNSGDLNRYSLTESTYLLQMPSMAANYASRSDNNTPYTTSMTKSQALNTIERKAVLSFGDSQAWVSTGMRNMYGMRVPHITAAWLIKDGHTLEASYNLRINEKTLSYNYQNYSVGLGSNVPLFKNSNTYTLFVKKSIPFQLGSF